MINPDDLLTQLNEDELNMNAEIDRLHRIQQLLSKNTYDGPYRDKFEDVYEDILEAKDIIEKEFADGFQFKDLENIVVAITPVLHSIYAEFYSTLKSDESEKFLHDLLVFIYLEVEDRLKVAGWLKWIFRLIFRLWVAGKIAKYLKIAFDRVEGEIVPLIEREEQRVRKFLQKLNY